MGSHWSHFKDNLLAFPHYARPLGPFPSCGGRLGRGGVRLDHGPRPPHPGPLPQGEREPRARGNEEMG